MSKIKNEIDTKAVQEEVEELMERQAIQEEEKEFAPPFIAVPQADETKKIKNQNPLIKLCGMYFNKGYINGQVGQIKYFISPNSFKEKASQPDYNLYVSSSYVKVDEASGQKKYPPSTQITGMWGNQDLTQLIGSVGNVNYLLLPNDDRATEKSPHYYLCCQEK